MEVKPLNSMGSLQPWLQVVRAVNPSASSQVTRKPCFEYDSVLLFENSSIDRVASMPMNLREKARCDKFEVRIWCRQLNNSRTPNIGGCYVSG